GLLSIVHHSPYSVRARRSPQQVLAHERRRGNRVTEMRGRVGSNPGPRLWYHVSAPHLANLTIKPRCYSGRGGGFYPQSNIPPTACEPGEPRGCATCPVSTLRSQRTQPGKSRSGNCVAGRDRTQDLGFDTKLEPRTSLAVGRMLV